MMTFQKGMRFKWECAKGTKVAVITEVWSQLVELSTCYKEHKEVLFFSKNGLEEKISRGKIIGIGPSKGIDWIAFGEQQKL